MAMPRNVLVVDDDEDIREAVGIALGTEGYNVITAVDGSDCLRQLHGRDRPDVILLDMMMPGMSGWEVCDALKRDPELMKIPVIILTGDLRVREDQGLPLLRKPIPLAALVDAIERHANAGRRRATS
jgi:CheY-like chemotaxis protein